MKPLAFNCRALVLVASVGVALPVGRAAAQIGAPPVSRWWPSGGSDSSALAVFGNVGHCTPSRCDRAGSFGVDARLAGQLRVAIDARIPGFAYGLSYGWRRVGISANVGGGHSVVLGVNSVPNATVSIVAPDSAGRTTADTSSHVSNRVDTTHTDVRWTSTEARLTWRDDRWWASALVGRVALAPHGASMWGGVQIGADLGRGASLLVGLGTTPHLLAAAMPSMERNNLSIGLGFSTALLSSRGHGPAERAPRSANAAFGTTAIGPGRVRVLIRAPFATSVSFASDCTQWTPVEMTRTADGWIVEIAASRGLHRANIRMDGGRWIAPPGLAASDDDFAGEVGIFVVE